MKLQLLLFFLIFYLSANAQNDPELFPINDRSVGFLGYYLKDGKTNVVKPQFCSASYNTDGYYLVSKAEHEFYEDGRRKENHIPNTEKFGLLNSKGQFIIDFNNNYDGIFVSAGIIYVIKDNLFGVLNEQKKIVIPIIYEEFNIENKNWIYAKNKKNKFGILNYSGETILPFKYDYIGKPIIDEISKDFLVIVQDNKKYGVINQNEQFVVPPTNSELTHLTKESIIALKKNKYGLLDYKLKVILPFEFETLDFYEDKIEGNKNGFHYSYTINGKLIEQKEILLEAEKSTE